MTAGADLIHVWHRCHACGAQPLVGVRYDCETCPAGPSNSLCESCYPALLDGTVEHPSADAAPAANSRHDFIAARGTSAELSRPWLAVPDAAGVAPAVPDRLVVRPEFCAGRHSTLGSYAFGVAMASGPRLLVTALHVLDELAKGSGIDCSVTNSLYSGRELPGLITEVVLYDVFAPRWMFANIGSAASMLTLPDARTGEVEPRCQRDVAAFVVEAAVSIETARLAERRPGVGEPVWLAAAGPSRGRTLGATVVESSDDCLIFRFIEADGPLSPTSGAPLLNANGDVAGINIGAGRFANRRYGHAAHVDSIKRQIVPTLAAIGAVH